MKSDLSEPPSKQQKKDLTIAQASVRRGLLTFEIDNQVCCWQLSRDIPTNFPIRTITSSKRPGPLTKFQDFLEIAQQDGGLIFTHKKKNYIIDIRALNPPSPPVIPFIPENKRSIPHSQDKETWFSYLRGALAPMLGSTDLLISGPDANDLKHLELNESSLRNIQAFKNDNRQSRLIVITLGEKKLYYFIKIDSRISQTTEGNIFKLEKEFKRNQIIASSHAGSVFVQPISFFKTQWAHENSVIDAAFMVLPFISSCELWNYTHNSSSTSTSSSTSLPFKLKNEHWLIGMYDLTAALFQLSEESPGDIKLIYNDLDQHQILVCNDYRLRFVDLGLAEVRYTDSVGFKRIIVGSSFSSGTSGNKETLSQMQKDMLFLIDNEKLKIDCKEAIAKISLIERTLYLKSLIEKYVPQVSWKLSGELPRPSHHDYPADLFPQNINI